MQDDSAFRILGRGHLTMAGTKRLFRVGPLTRRALSLLYIPHLPGPFYSLPPPHQPFIPVARLACEIADRNFSNFPNGLFLVEKSSGQLKWTSRTRALARKWKPGIFRLPPQTTNYIPSNPLSITNFYHRREQRLSSLGNYSYGTKHSW